MHVDVLFFHKRTCDRLLNELGPFGPLAFLSLIAEAKRSNMGGTCTFTSEADFWDRLGLAGRDVGFSMDDLLTLLGRVKQTRRTCVGRVMNVKLTRYEQWQNDARRYDERERKSSKRRESKPDTSRTRGGQPADAVRTETLDLERDKPPTPFAAPNGNCPECGVAIRAPTTLADHLYATHDIEAA